MFNNRSPLIFQKKNMIKKEVKKSNFSSAFIKDSIKETTKKVK
jgi:hypothetical protein